jgi:hypothetical protein
VESLKEYGEKRFQYTKKVKIPLFAGKTLTGPAEACMAMPSVGDVMSNLAKRNVQITME